LERILLSSEKMDINVVLVGKQNNSYIKSYLEKNNISLSECNTFSEFKPLLKKGYKNIVFFYDTLSSDDHILALRDATLFGGICSIHYMVSSDDTYFSFDDTFSSEVQKFNFSEGIDSFISLF